MKQRYLLHLTLFVLTFFSVSLAGVQWLGKDFTELTNINYGFTYGLLIIFFLSAHEFGHYIASRVHGVQATLPFFIPLPPAPGFPSLFGTMGAVIKTRSAIMSRKALFDIGVSGPIAGFIVSLAYLIYGFINLPTIDYIYNIHPEYLLYNNGEIPTGSLHFGDTLLYYLLAKIFANPDGFLPPMNEMYHYLYLNAGWFGLFVTSLNMIPIGQLDGGHVVYAMFGRDKQIKIARISWWIIFSLGLLAILGTFYNLVININNDSSFIFLKVLLGPLNWLHIRVPFLFEMWPGWLFWAFITRLFIKIEHPPIPSDDELSKGRKIIGWFSLIILLLSLSYNGIYIID